MKTTPQRGDWSPWGAIQEAAEVAPGLTRVHTASHGGLHLDRRLQATLPATFEGSREWHEEDCHAPMVAWYLGTTADYCDLPNLNALGSACEQMAASLATAAAGMKRHGWAVASAGCRATVDRWGTLKAARLCSRCGNRRAPSGVCHHRDCPPEPHPLARMKRCRHHRLGPLDDEGGRTCLDCRAVVLCPGWRRT